MNRNSFIMILKGAVLLNLLVFINTIHCLTLNNDDAKLELDLATGYIKLKSNADGGVKLSGQIGANQSLNSGDCLDGSPNCYLEVGDESTLNITSVDGGFQLVWQSNSISTIFQDCFDLQIDGSSNKVHWYGGQEQWSAQWPLETLTYKNEPYISSTKHSGAVLERYWLNSKGGYIFVSERVPLFIDQNSIKSKNLCLIAKLGIPYVNRYRVLLSYTIIAQSDPRSGHMHAIDKYIGTPTEHPNERIVRNPIWTTWAKYKKDISDETVLSFAQDIAKHGFTGQIEIDDFWETCYGTLSFNDKFSDIKNTVTTLKNLGFTVTLWVHPFVNDDCTNTTEIGRANGYFIQNYNNDSTDYIDWWDGHGHHIDFTNIEARYWYAHRLKQIQKEYGIDAFKFDAGESNYATQAPILHDDDVELAPNSLTESYLRTVATFGNLIEVRAGWRTQDLPMFVRVLDKDSRWGLDNGLHALIVTLIQMNIMGYPMVLPDMIGGNGYGIPPTAEILARWTQANAFMPSMQFSYLPWDITSEDVVELTAFDGLAIINKFVKLHMEYSDDILRAMDYAILRGTPVNPPIWWIDPTNPDALICNDEYLVGEKILVAPVIQEGATTRDIVIPTGSWRDGNTDEIIEGPQIIKDYNAPIDVLPYFILVES